jgi:hypothetical protein
MRRSGAMKRNSDEHKGAIDAQCRQDCLCNWRKQPEAGAKLWVQPEHGEPKSDGHNDSP